MKRKFDRFMLPWIIVTLIFGTTMVAPVFSGTVRGPYPRPGKGAATMKVTPQDSIFRNPSNGTWFTVNVRIADATFVAMWQVELIYRNDSLFTSPANITYAPAADHIFGSTYTPVVPTVDVFNATHNYLLHTAVSSPYTEFNATDKGLFTVNFQIIKVPGPGEALDSLLYFTVLPETPGIFGSYTLDINLDENNITLMDGYYKSIGPPKAIFNWAPTSPYVYQTVTFDAGASYVIDGSIVNYVWTWGDGSPANSSTQSTMTHVYKTQGNKNVTLTVTDNYGFTNTAWQVVTVQPAPPVALFNWDPLAPLVNEAVTFDASASYDVDGSILNYGWNFGDGNTATTGNPITIHNYNATGDYNVTLTVTDNDGLTGTTWHIVTVIPSPTPPYPEVLAITADVGTIHFPGELAEFYVLVTYQGVPVNTTAPLTAKLYFQGGFVASLLPEFVDTGVYRIRYQLLVNAQPGTYALVIQAKYFSQKVGTLKSFLISPGFGEAGAMLVSIYGNVTTILVPDVGYIRTNLSSINATISELIVDSKGEILAKIDTALGPVTTKLNTIGADVTTVKGDTATIKTTLGDIQTSLGGLQGAGTAIVYVTAALSGIAAIVAIIILVLLIRKK